MKKNYKLFLYHEGVVNTNTLLVETMFFQYKNKRRRNDKHLETRLQRKHM